MRILRVITSTSMRWFYSCQWAKTRYNITLYSCTVLYTAQYFQRVSRKAGRLHQNPRHVRRASSIQPADRKTRSIGGLAARVGGNGNAFFLRCYSLFPVPFPFFPVPVNTLRIMWGNQGEKILKQGNRVLGIY